jgi:hypothetical protein
MPFSLFRIFFVEIRSLITTFTQKRQGQPIKTEKTKAIIERKGKNNLKKRRPKAFFFIARENLNKNNFLSF